MTTPTNTDEFLVKAGGMALFITSLIQLPAAILALLKVPLSLYAILNSGETRIDQIIRTLNAQLIAQSIIPLFSFLILLRLSFWVFGYPNLLRKLFNRFTP